MSNNAIRFANGTARGRPSMHVVQAGGMAPMGIMDEVMAEEAARRAANTAEARHEALVNAYLEATDPKQPRAYASVALEPGGRIDFYSQAKPVVVTKVCFVARRFRYAHAKLQYLLK